MKKRFLVLFLIAIFVLIIVDIQNIVIASDNFKPLFKYKSDEPILLHEEQVKIPQQISYKKSEFRGVWISTVSNIDFPSKKGLSEKEYKKEYIDILNKLQAMNINAVIFQIRPMNDAFYKSKLNPWSKYLTGKQGVGPGWDPLKWMIEETHKRNMEFHAWLNPYRVAQGFSIDKPTDQVLKEELSKLANNNFAKLHPDCVVRFSDKLFLDPARPEVQKFIKDTVVEIVKNYDVDAIHFDDYFYPYKTSKIDPITGKKVPLVFGDALEDKESFERYGKGYSDIKDWRRDNINNMIKSVSQAIKKEKPYVKFGISPFGIWGHIEKHPEGSKEGVGSHTPVTSQSSYDDIYADTRKWVKEGWIDYIIPQIYWSFANTAAPYAELVDWWADVVKDTNCQLYIGHAIFKCGDNSDVNWNNPEEIINQLKFNSLYQQVRGSAFFSLKNLIKNNNSGVNELKNFYKTKALIPPMTWLDNKPPMKISSLKVSASNKKINIYWSDTLKNDSMYYVVYRFNGNKFGNMSNPNNIITIIKRDKGQKMFKFVDTKANINQSYTYAITAIDRIGNESKETVITYIPNKNNNRK